MEIVIVSATIFVICSFLNGWVRSVCAEYATGILVLVSMTLVITGLATYCVPMVILMIIMLYLLYRAGERHRLLYSRGELIRSAGE